MRNLLDLILINGGDSRQRIWIGIRISRRLGREGSSMEIFSGCKSSSELASVRMPSVREGCEEVA